jgi:hypothetical protein
MKKSKNNQKSDEAKGNQICFLLIILEIDVWSAPLKSLLEQI